MNESRDSWLDPELSDGCVTLRRWGLVDLPALGEAGSDPTIQRFRYSVPSTELDARWWLVRLDTDREAGARLEFAITVDPSGAAVGSISLADFVHHSAMIRYWLLPAARGRGVAASAAVRLLAGWSIDALQIARLWMQIEPDNHPSRQVAESCGFVLEGRLRSHWETKEGRRCDLLIYGLLPGELRSGRRESEPTESAAQVLDVRDITGSR
jgi:ribosomal-protein-alanine N-acetyltransferase